MLELVLAFMWKLFFTTLIPASIMHLTGEALIVRVTIPQKKWGVDGDLASSLP